MRTLLIFCVILGFNYGVSFQQFLHFDWNDPRGLSDASSYLAMSKGDFDVPEGHRYRIIIPFLVEHLRELVQVFIPVNQLNWLGGIDALVFYIVNSFITSLAGLFLYLFLIELKFEAKLALLGVFIFLSSRITILSTGGPLVDSLYFLAIIVVVYFCLTQRSLVLSLLNPLLILTKETTVPFLFLPLFIKTMNRKIILLSLFISFGIFFWVRSEVTALASHTINIKDPLWDIIINHFASAKEIVMQSYLTVAGWHNIFSAFSIFWLFAALGAWLDFRAIETQVPRFLFWLLPATLGFTLLSSNTGRMVLSLFPLVIPYALIGIEFLLFQKAVSAKV